MATDEIGEQGKPKIFVAPLPRLAPGEQSWPSVNNGRRTSQKFMRGSVSLGGPELVIQRAESDVQ